jgi:hypothetical protein
MKTKFQILAAFVGFVALSNVAFAWEPSFKTAVNDKSKSFNVVTAPEGCNNILTNAIVLSDGTVINNDAKPSNVISHESTTANDENIDNTQSLLSYHHGSSGSGESAINNKNVVYVGIGFISILGALASVLSFGTGIGGASGTTVSSIPAITVAYERGLSEHWGVGAMFCYQSISVNSTGTIDNTSQGFGPYNGYEYPNNQGQSYSYTDKLTLTGISFGATGAYHFTASEKVDPYIALALGYTSIGFSYSNNDPNAQYDGNSSTAPPITFGGFTFGAYVGLRVYFTNNIGAWADFGYFGVGSAVFNFGLAFKF